MKIFRLIFIGDWSFFVNIVIFIRFDWVDRSKYIRFSGLADCIQKKKYEWEGRQERELVGVLGDNRRVKRIPRWFVVV